MEDHEGMDVLACLAADSGSGGNCFKARHEADNTTRLPSFDVAQPPAGGAATKLDGLGEVSFAPPTPDRVLGHTKAGRDLVDRQIEARGGIAHHAQTPAFRGHKHCPVAKSDSKVVSVPAWFLLTVSIYRKPRRNAQHSGGF